MGMSTMVMSTLGMSTMGMTTMGMSTMGMSTMGMSTMDSRLRSVVTLSSLYIDAKLLLASSYERLIES